MRNLKKILVAIVLAFVVGTPVCAGDMPTPPFAPPPPVTSQATNPPDGDSQVPVTPDDLIDPTDVVFDLLYGMLSIY